MAGAAETQGAAQPAAWPLRAGLTLLVALLVIGAASLGLFRPLDNGLVDWRFGRTSHAPSGGIVLVEIDPASLRQVGVWPWPRHVYAQLLDKLMALGAAETTFDIDFSSASTEADDAAFADALHRAGGYAYLAAFRQFSSVANRLEVTLPLPRFLKEAEPVVVNVLAEPDGIVRRYSAGMTVGGTYYPSLAERLSGKMLAADERFYIDYGIDAAHIDRVSVADVLSGAVDPARIAGRQVVIAAGAQELRDIFTVPRFSTVSGGLLQILAAETLRQDRMLSARGSLGVGSAIVVLLAAAFYLLRRRGNLWLDAAAAAAVLIAVEGLAYAAQAQSGFLLRTGMIDVAALGYLAGAILQELENKRRREAAAARERDEVRRILDRVIADNFDGVVVIDGDREVIAASGMADRLLGGGEPLTGRHLVNALPAELQSVVLAELDPGQAAPPAPAPAEITIELGGDRRTLEYVVRPSAISLGQQGERRVACLTFRDISERRRSQERLAFLAQHDGLTGALSRRAFVDAIEAALSTHAGRDDGLTLLMVDLGRFRPVNELFGHSFGDELMREVVRRLESLDLMAIGRVGGDSFAVARRGLLEGAEARRFGHDIIALLAEPYVIGGARAVLSAHAGLTTSAFSGLHGDVLLSHADMALSAAKDTVGNAVEIFTPAMTTRLVEKQELEAGLREALAENQFEVYYQPLVSLADRQIVGVEALLRWFHPTLGSISPARFIPVAEETGLIVELGRHVLLTASREVASWPADIGLAVNASPVQFELGDVVGDVRLALADSGLAPERLDIEITEGVSIHAGHPARSALERLRSLGVHIALDDFGTGYSALAYLSQLPADKLKIDRSFVDTLPGNDEGRAVVTAILQLARSLGKATVAEGVETESQAALLTRLGCELGQGYLFGKPMPADELKQRFFAEPSSAADRESAVILRLAPRA